MEQVNAEEVSVLASPDAERSILGAILLDTDRFDELRATLVPDDFFLDSHKRTSAAMGRLFKKERAIDLVTLAEELQRTREIDAIGGIAYLAGLTEGLPRKIHIAEYIQIVKEKSVLRKLKTFAESTAVRCMEQSDTAVDIFNTFVKDAEKISQSAKTYTPPVLGEQVLRTLDNYGAKRSGKVQTFVPSGFDLIDEGEGGYAIGELTVIAAREKVGKSVLLRQGIYANCERGNFCHFISPELTDEQVLLMLASRKAGIPWNVVRHPQQVNLMQMDYLRGCMLDIAEWPLHLDCTYPLSPLEMLSRAKAIKEQYNTQFFGLDYLQKLDFGRNYDHRFAMIGDTWVGLSNLAKTGSGMAVVVISSLTTSSRDKDRNRAPTPDDLRGSGEGKYELSTLYLMHRKTDPETAKLSREGQLITGLARFDEDGSRDFLLNPDLLILEKKSL